MKTLKHVLLLVILTAAFSQTKAQCIWAAYASPNGANVQFYAYVDSSTFPATYSWDFGDGGSSTTLNPVHTYTQSGTYNYCFHYTGTGCSQDSCGSVTVDLCSFHPQITSSANQLTVTLGATNAPVGSTYSWIIYTGGSNTITSTLANPVVTFPTWGTYSAGLTVTSPLSCVDTAFTYIILDNPCTAHIYDGVIGATTVQFMAYPYDSLNPTSFSYAWTFGDGGTASIANPSHDYGGFGSWNACVTVTGSNCTDTHCQQVTLSPPPPPTYNLSGTISNGGSAACWSTVYLIREDSAGYLALSLTSYTVADSGGCTGNYSFNNVPQGTYYLKAALDSGDVNHDNYLPTYYGDVLTWGTATAINVNNDQGGLDIHLIGGVNPGGPGFVGGWVSQGAGLAAGGGSNINRAVGDPLPNIQINLLTINNVPVASTYTDAGGHYTFSNLALGTYKVYAEEINKVPFALDVTLTANNPSQDNINVSVNSNSAVTGINDLSDIHLESVYPNPVTDKATVSISLKQNSKVRMTLTDVNGRLLQSKNLDLNSGPNEINLDLNSEPAGIYHLSLLNNVSKKIIRLVKIK